MCKELSGLSLQVGALRVRVKFVCIKFISVLSKSAIFIVLPLSSAYF